MNPHKRFHKISNFQSISDRGIPRRMTGRAPLQPTNSTNLPPKPRPLPNLPGFKPPHTASSYASRPPNLAASHIMPTSSVSTTSKPLTVSTKPLSSSLGKPTVALSSTASSRPAGQTTNTTSAMAPPRYCRLCLKFNHKFSCFEGHVLDLPLSTLLLQPLLLLQTRFVLIGFL